MCRGFFSFLVLLFLVRLAAADAPDASRVRVAPRPDWVRTEGDPDFAAGSSEGATRGIYYWLIDRQAEVEKQESYSHVAYKITSAAGVQGASQVAFSFDPDYQTIDLHTLAIWRDGQRQDRLDLGKMQLLQQERDLERHQYNGQLTALFLLEDVRVGDGVEYSYTRKGENPIFGRHYMNTEITRWSAPIHRQAVRLLVARDRPLTYQQLGGSPLTLVVKSEGERVEYLWQAQDQTAAEFEAGAPSWYLPYSLLQVTDFKSWKDVVEWARPLYEPTPLSESLRAKLKEITAGALTSGQRAAAVLEFVQNDIRYLGIELGARSHAPSDPDRVFQLRYGDCKDKVRLFCAMLHELDISAVPALTHSARGKTLNDSLPSIEAFDHVIARVDLADKSYWVDPTLTDQAGTLGNRALPNYGWALPIEPGSHALQQVDNTRISLPTPLDLQPAKSLHLRPSPSLTFNQTDKHRFKPMQADPADVQDLGRSTEVRVTESFIIGQPGGPAELEVRSVFCGPAADGMRGYLRETPPDQLGKHLLNLRAKFFPNLKLVGKPNWTDDRKRNEITLEHHYQVPQFWRKEEKSPVLTAEVYPLILRDYLAAPETMVRSAPYAVQFPLHVVCEIDLNFQNPWPTQPETRTVRDPAFEGHYSVARYGNQVSLKYEFTTLMDAVEATRMEEYATHLHDFRDTFGMTLTFNPEIAKRNARFRLNGTMLMIGTVFLTVGSALGFLIYRRWDSRERRA